MSLGSVSVTSGTIRQQSSINVVGDLTDNGTTYLNGNVTTTGNQTYNGAVHLTNSDTLTSTNNGNVTFDSTLDGTTSGQQNLTISTGTGSTTFDGAVGSTVSLGSVSVTSGTITQQSTMNVVGNLTNNGATYLNGNVTTTGNQTYNGAVHLTNSDTLTSTSNGNVTFDSTVNGTSTFAQSLTLRTGAGSIKFAGNIGEVVKLNNVTVISAHDVSLQGSLSAETFQQESGTGITSISGAINTYGTIGMTNDGFQFMGSSLQFKPATSSLNSNGYDISLTADAITLPTTFVKATDATVTIQTLSAATSIGLGDATQVLNFTDSQLDVINSTNVVIGSVTQTGGIKIGTDGPISQLENYLFKTAASIVTNGLFTLDAGHSISADVGNDLIISSGGKLSTSAGSITLNMGRDAYVHGAIVTDSGALSISSGHDLSEDGLVKTNSGNVRLTIGQDAAVAGRFVTGSGSLTWLVGQNTTFSSTSQIQSTSGDMTLTTGTAVPGVGTLLMSDGSLINAGTGRATLTAEQDITLGQISTANTTNHAIEITSHFGGIINGEATGVNLISEMSGGVVTLNAATGIGSTQGVSHDPAILTDVNALKIVNSTSGDVRIHETNDLQVTGIDQRGPGGVAVHADGTINVIAVGTGVDSHSGAILLAADGASSNLDLGAAVSTTGGGITLQAGHDVVIDKTAPITSLNGNVQVSADAKLIANGASGQLLMSDGSVINAGSGTINLHADQNMTIGQVATTNSTSLALRIVSTSGSIVDAGNSIGDNLIANSIGAVTTIQALDGVGASATGAIHTALDTLNLSNGVSSSHLNGSTTDVRILERDSIKIHSLVQNNGGIVNIQAQGDIIVGQIIGATNFETFVSLQSKLGGIIDGAGSNAINVSAATLLLQSATGIGSDVSLFSTKVLNISAINSGSGNIELVNSSGQALNVVTVDGITGITNNGSNPGNVVLSNNASINVKAAITDSTGGNVAISAFPATANITVAAPIEAIGGNGNVTISAGYNIDLRDTGTGVDILSNGTGIITISAQNLVTFETNAKVQSGTGAITDAPPRFVNLLTPQITAGGVVTVSGDYGRPGEQDFTITVRWNDGTYTQQTFTSLVTAAEPGHFVFSHFYHQNPNLTDQAAPIPVDVTVHHDGNIRVFGQNTTKIDDTVGTIDLTPNPVIVTTHAFAVSTGNAVDLDFTTSRSLAAVPGEGFHSIAFDVTPPVEYLHLPEAVVVNDLLHETISAPTLVGIVDHDIQVKVEVATSERLVYFVVTAPDGTFQKIQLKELDLDDLLGAIRKNKASDQSTLPDGKYEILVQEPGETSLRTVLEFKIVNGSIDDGSESTRDQLPSSGEPRQTAPDPKSIDGDSADSGTVIPENIDDTNGKREGASGDSTIISQLQTIAIVESSTMSDGLIKANTFNTVVPRFGAKSSRIEWNHENETNVAQNIDFALDHETVEFDSSDSVDQNQVIIGGETNVVESSVMFCGAASLVIRGVGRLKNKSEAEENQAASPRLDRAARLLRKSVTFRGVSQ